MDNDGIHAASIDNEENNTEKNLHEESDLSAIAEIASGTATEEQQMQVPSKEEENDRRSRFIMLQKSVKRFAVRLFMKSLLFFKQSQI
jgi:hypothetical protein